MSNEGAETSLITRIKGIFSGSSGSDKRPSSDEKPAPVNTINELQILNAHTDIVRTVVKLDETRIASASDDATINIWNYVTGERLVTLLGHKMPITCLLLLDSNSLVSGSSDRTIRMWDLTTGACTRVLTQHQGSIRALCMLPKLMFCSGANDRQLCVWSLQGELVSTIERQEEENLHCLICVSNEWVVTASNSQFLLAYHIESQQPFKILVYHRESVQCLVKISDKFFASASLDGCIVVWHTDTFTPRVLSFPEIYRSSEKIFIYSVHYLLPLGEGYLVVAIGKKVELYDIVTGECVLECENTHESTITCMISLYGGTRLLTASADSSIKIWELPNFTQLSLASSNVITSPKRHRKKKTNHPIKAVCVGDMWGHTDGVYCMTPLTDNSLASCGGDGSVVLWKDGQVQSDMRNNFATVSLLRHTTSMDDFQDENYEEYPYGYNEFSSDGGSFNDEASLTLALDSARLDQEAFFDDSSDYETQYHYNTIQPSTPPQPTIPAPPSPPLSPSLSPSPSPRSSLTSSSGSLTNLSSSLKRTGSITIPEYIFKHAEMLRIEKKLSLQTISEQLRDQGHSENLIVAVTQKQLAMMDLQKEREDMPNLEVATSG